MREGEGGREGWREAGREEEGRGREGRWRNTEGGREGGMEGKRARGVKGVVRCNDGGRAKQRE